MMSYLSVLVALTIICTASAGQYSYFPCPTLFDYYPHPSNCGRFFRCAWGAAFEFQCAAGTYWNQAQRTCDHAYNNPCVYNYNTVVESTAVHNGYAAGAPAAVERVVTDTHQAVVNDGYGYAAGYPNNAYWSGYNSGWGNGGSWAANDGHGYGK